MEKRQIDIVTKAEVPVDGEAVKALMLAVEQNPAKKFSGLMVAQGKLYIVAADQVMKSDGSGPPAGVLCFARPLDQATSVKLSLELHVQASFNPTRPEELQRRLSKSNAQEIQGANIFIDHQSARKITGIAFLPDINGSPSAMAEVTATRDIYLGGLSALFNAAAAIVTFGLIFTYVTITIIDRTILRRMTAMVDKINTGDREKIDFGEKKDDEIGVLAHTIEIAFRAEAARAREFAESERRKEMALAAGDLGHWEYDLRTKRVFFSERFKTMLGYGPGEVADLWGTWNDLLHPEDRSRVINSYSEVLAMRNPHWDMEYRLKCKDGQFKMIHSRGRVVLSDDRGLPLVISGTHMDITDTVKTREQRTRFEDQIKQTQKMQALATLAGGIAHNFNNILAAIMGYTELVMDDVPKASQSYDNLKEVLNASTRAGELVRQMLIFSNAREKFYETVDIRKLMEESFKFMRDMVPTSIEMISSFPDLPIIVNFDSYQFREALINVFTNAVESMDPDKGRLIVTLGTEKMNKTGWETSSGEYAVITVTDNGHGMPPEILERAFDPYFTTKTDLARVGLGLAVVHSIITGAGGEVTATSKPGEGTTVTMKIPAVIGLHEDERHWPSDLGGNERILFVDDERLLTDIARQYFGKLGYDITVELDPINALKLFKADPQGFDILITDMVMPKMNGLEFCVEINKERPDLPMILCSGYLDIVDDAERKRVGISELLRKPVSMEDLAKRMRGLLEK